MFSTPGQLEYVPDNATERGANGSRADETDGNFFLHHWMEILILLIASLGLLGNGVVLWLLGFRIPRTPFSVYILNLAAADVLFLCFIFLDCIDEFHSYLSGGSMFEVMLSLESTSYSAGLSLLAAISTERCVSALFPIWHRCRRPKHTSAVVCFVLWVMAGMFGTTNFFLCFKIRFIIYAVYFLLLPCIMCVSSLTLVLRVQCSSQRQQPPRLYLLVLLTVLVFLLFGLLTGIFSFLDFFFYMDPIPYWIHLLPACINSSVNPLIYFFVGRQRHARKEPLSVVLQRALGDEQDSQEV